MSGAGEGAEDVTVSESEAEAGRERREASMSRVCPRSSAELDGDADGAADADERVEGIEGGWPEMEDGGEEALERDGSGSSEPAREATGPESDGEPAGRLSETNGRAAEAGGAEGSSDEGRLKYA